QAYNWRPYRSCYQQESARLATIERRSHLTIKMIKVPGAFKTALASAGLPVPARGANPGLAVMHPSHRANLACPAEPASTPTGPGSGHRERNAAAGSPAG